MRHSSVSAPSSTVMVMNLVAPSPSRTIACASVRATSVMAASKAWPSALARSVTGALPAWPVAITMKLSLVEVSPSTVTRLNEASASCLASAGSSSGATAASVARKPSMVAMLGRIMPAPLEMPVTLTVLPPTWAWRLAALATVSVVMMPSAALSQ